MDSFERTYYIEINYDDITDINNYLCERMQIKTYVTDWQESLKEAYSKAKLNFKTAKDTRIYKKKNVKLYNEWGKLITTIKK